MMYYKKKKNVVFSHFRILVSDKTKTRKSNIEKVGSGLDVIDDGE